MADLQQQEVIGSYAVHPGELDVRDNLDIARHLFPLVNLIVYEMITCPREIAELYGSLPQRDLDTIAKCDKGTRSQ